MSKRYKATALPRTTSQRTLIFFSRPWHKASHSNCNGTCAEVTEGPITGARDTKHRELGALFFRSEEWRAFLGASRNDVR